VSRYYAEHDYDTGPQQWREHSACYGLDPTLFDYSPHHLTRAAQAAAVCAGCPVKNRHSDLATRSSGDCETFHDNEQKHRMPLHTIAAGFVYQGKEKRPMGVEDWPACGNPLCGRPITLAGDPREQRKFCSYTCLTAVRRAG
jgi:hypothetical protein